MPELMKLAENCHLSQPIRMLKFQGRVNCGYKYFYRIERRHEESPNKKSPKLNNKPYSGLTSLPQA